MVSQLDHMVIHTANPDRALAGDHRGLSLVWTCGSTAQPRLGARQLFTCCGDAVVEIRRPSLKRSSCRRSRPLRRPWPGA